MKYFHLLVIVVAICGSCLTNCSLKKDDLFGFEQVTIHLPKTELMSDDPYYLAENVCFYTDSYVLQINSQFYLISNDFKSIKALPQNEAGALLYNELFVYKDSLMITSTWEDEIEGDNLFFEYYDSKLEKWQLVKKIPQPITSCSLETNFEDDFYEVCYLMTHNKCYLQFKDKHTHRKYVYNIYMERMLEYHNSYYVIGPYAIYKIDVPFGNDTLEKEVLQQVPTDIDVEPYILGSTYGEGTIFNSGIIRNDELYIIGKIANEPAIAQLQEDSLHVVYRFNDEFLFTNTDYSDRFRLGANDYSDKVVLCYRKDDEIGFFMIDGKSNKRITVNIEE